MKLKAEFTNDNGKKFPAVSFVGIHPVMWLAHKTVCEVFKENGLEVKVTAGTELARLDVHNNYSAAIHSDTSAHPWGFAIDYSRADIPTEFKAVEIQVEIQRRLDEKKKGYEVVLSPACYHVEFDRILKGLE